jgi:hypothetical protein
MRERCPGGAALKANSSVQEETAMGRFMGKFWMILTAMALALAVAACGPGRTSAPPSPQAAAEAAGAPLPELVITADEYSFAGPESVSGGWTQVTLDNQGARSHDLILFRIDEGKSMDDVMAAIETGAAEQGPPDWISVVGEATAEAGQRKRFIVNLAPGSYGMISFGEEESGPPDVAQGMVKGITVTAAPATQVVLSQPDATIALLDFGYTVSALRAGEQLIELRNTGAEDHEAVFLRLHEGKTIEDARALLALPEEQQDQQVDTLGTYAGGMSAGAGQTVYMDQEFAPGRYALICFLPSPANGGAPHYELGMLREVVVQ